MAEFTSEQMDEMKEAFELFDKDADGKINGDELATVLRAIGQSPTQAQMKDIYKELGISNTSGAGTIDFNGFVNVAKKRVKNSSPQQLQAETDEQIKEAFKVFDKNGTGSIDVSELKHILINLGEKLLPSEVDAVMKEADTDGDGKITIQDFLRVLKSAK